MSLPWHESLLQHLLPVITEGTFIELVVLPPYCYLHPALQDQNEEITRLPFLHDHKLLLQGLLQQVGLLLALGDLDLSVHVQV